MLELPVLNDKGEIRPMAACEIAATMLAPEESKKRHEILLSYTKLAGAEMEQVGYTSKHITEIWDIWIPRYGGFQAFSKAQNPGTKDVDIERRAWKGMVAGKVIKYLVYLDQQNQPTGIRRAIHVVEQELKYIKKRKGKKPRSIYEAWRQFKNVCHLWAANALWQQSGKSSGPFPFIPEEELPFFLSIADWFYRKAKETKSSSTNRIAFAPDNPWVPPSQLILPALKLTLGRNTRADKAAATYKAR